MEVETENDPNAISQEDVQNCVLGYTQVFEFRKDTSSTRVTAQPGTGAPVVEKRQGEVHEPEVPPVPVPGLLKFLREPDHAGTVVTYTDDIQIYCLHHQS